MSEHRPSTCQQCGNLVRPEDKFCGSCGAVVLPPAPQAEQVIPEPPPAVHSTQNNRTLLLAGVVSVLLLMVGGAVAYATIGPGIGLLGGSDRQEDDESPPAEPPTEQGGTTARDETTKERTISLYEGSTKEKTSPPPKEKTVPRKNQDQPSGTNVSEAEAEEAAGDYYRAAGSQDFNYTYDNLDSTTKSKFTREEWRRKNQWFADNSPAIYNIESVELDERSQRPLAEVEVRLTGEDGSSSIRNTYFVYEDGEWLHRFAQEEIDLFEPGVSFEEWLDISEMLLRTG